MTVQPLYFLHIPKTAGTSLKQWLTDYYADEQCCDFAHLLDIQELPCNKLARYRFFGGHFGLGLYKLIDNQLPTVTWLRDPAERFFSSYRYIIQNKAELVTIAQKQQLDALVQHYEKVSKSSITEYAQLSFGYTDNVQVRYLSGQPPLNPKFQKCNDDMLALALETFDQLLHVGICEWMQPSIDLMCYRLGWIPRAFDLRLNQTPKSGKFQKRSSFYNLTEEEQQIIINANRYDFMLYDYAKEKFKTSFTEMWNLVEDHEETLNFYSTSSEVDSKNIEILDDGFLSLYESLSKGCITAFLETNFKKVHNADERQRSIFLSCGDSIFHTGWHPRQYNYKKQEWFRWNTSKRKTAIYLPLKAGQWYQIAFSILFKTTSGIKKLLEFEVNHKAISLELIPITSNDGVEQYIVTGMLSPDCISLENAYAECIFFINNKSNERYLADYDRLFAIGDIHIEPFNKVSSPFQVILDLQKHLVHEQNNSSNFNQEVIHPEKIDETKNSRLKSLKDKKKRLNQRLKKYQMLLMDTQKELEASQKELEAIKNSKLWKIRNVWTQIKRKLGLVVDS